MVNCGVLRIPKWKIHGCNQIAQHTGSSRKRDGRATRHCHMREAWCTISVPQCDKRQEPCREEPEGIEIQRYFVDMRPRSIDQSDGGNNVPHHSSAIENHAVAIA